MSNEPAEVDAYEASLKRALARKQIIGGVIFLLVGLLSLSAWLLIVPNRGLALVSAGSLTSGAGMLAGGLRQLGRWPAWLPVSDQVGEDDGDGGDDGDD